MLNLFVEYAEYVVIDSFTISLLAALLLQVLLKLTLAIAFGDKVYFGGPIHGLVILIAVILVMLIAEEAIVRLVRRLA